MDSDTRTSDALEAMPHLIESTKAAETMNHWIDCTRRLLECYDIVWAARLHGRLSDSQEKKYLRILKEHGEYMDTLEIAFSEHYG